MAGVELKPLPPEEALRYFRAKGFKPSFAWQDVWQHEHAQAFTVAKAMRLDLLQDIRAAVDRALAEGRTLAQFQKELQPLLEEKGWWGRQQMIDPKDGKLKSVQLGSPRRLETIFNVNLRTSYAAGKWAQVERLKQRRPYLRYVAVLDDRTRDEHRQWHGTVLPVDDPWWQSHYPPNGWNCRCTVQQLSDRDLDRFGYEVDDAPPPAPTTAWQNPRTGEVVRVPEGIDPGFGYNVGEAARFPDPAKYDVGYLGHEAARIAVDSTAFADLVSGKLQGKAPIGWLDDAVARAIGSKVRRLDLSSDTIKKQLAAHPELTLDEYRMLPEMIARGLIIQDGPTTAIFFARAGRTYKIAAKRTKSGEAAYATSFRRVEQPDREIRSARARGKVIRTERPED
jgi:SPP1 gp7 family putative phage head morphogenesis protein